MSNHPGFRWRKWTVIAAVTAVILGAVLWYFKGRDSAVAQYQTAEVTRGDLVQIVTASGGLNPVLNVQVGSQISGIIRKLYADFNSVVRSNEIVAEIDPSTYQMTVLKAEADVANARAALELSQVQARRADALFADKLISGSDHDTAIAQLHQAEAQVQADEATLRTAKVQLSYCTIYAPVDGVVISRNVDVGQTVAASFNTPTLFLIANDLSKMQIDALVSEADIGGVATNQTVKFTVDAYPYRTFQGKVSQIRYGPVTNQNVVCYDAVVQVDNPDLKLLPGMTANVSIITAERQGALKTPNAALRFRPPETASSESSTNAAPRNAAGGARPGATGGGGGSGGAQGAASRAPARSGGGPQGEKATPRTVYMLDTAKDPNRPELVPVKIRTGINDGISTEVLEGLKEGDRVVTGLLNSQADTAARPTNPFGSGGRRF